MSNTITLPNRFLFRFSFPVYRIKTGNNLTKGHELPDVADLDSETPFAKVSVGWREDALVWGFRIMGKTTPVLRNEKDLFKSDNIQLWLDLRNTQSIHRANRFCYQFLILPTTHELPARTIHQPIARAREETPLIESEEIETTGTRGRDFYEVTVRLPASVLSGYDPSTFRKLSFYYFIQDQERGDQYLAVGRDFPFSSDPSLWWTLELVDQSR